jgi:hypothetical protein
LNLHKSRVRRNHWRLRSHGFIERAQSASPNFAPRRKRASDKALTFLDNFWFVDNPSAISATIMNTSFVRIARFPARIDIFRSPEGMGIQENGDKWDC